MKPMIRVLSDEEISRLHQSALKILSVIGMRFPHEKALTLLAEAGAAVEGDKIAKIPETLVSQAIEMLAKRKDVILYGRDSRHDIDFSGHNPAIASMCMAVSVIDPYTRQKRAATNDDLAKLTRIADRLENIHVNGGLITPQDVPRDYNDWYTWATTIKNTAKHITGGMYGASCVRDAAEMAAIAVGSQELFRKRPFISGWVLTLPPLGIDAQSLDALMEMSRLKIPVMLSSGPILGTTSPVTIAGTIAQAHAEILGCIVVSQLTNSGAPIIYTSFARGVDMRSGNISMACPESGILKVAMAQMGRYLDLPIRMPAMLRDAKVIDAQAGFETGMIGTIAGLAADLLDAMQLDMDLVVDYPDLVFCNECMAAIQRMVRELTVNDETIALDAIQDVGIGGNYLGHPHTYANFKQELWLPQIFERKSWDSWAKSGCLDILQVAEKKVLTLLEETADQPISEEAAKQIDCVVHRARNSSRRG
jgi:trimethylamine:corrinoid methyltransferase-like protein